MLADAPLAWIAAGSNLGDRLGFLARARALVAATAGVQSLIATVPEETVPLGGLVQPAYINQMFRVKTTLAPRQLLARCHEIERAAGRRRTTRWESRTLDLDLVRYGDMMCDLPDLTLPHPGLRDRSFWARELAVLEDHG